MARDYFYHERSLQGKIDRNYKKRGRAFACFKSRVYNPYKAGQLSISKIDFKSISKKARLLSKYHKAVDIFNVGNWITSQSKFRPTVLEEFCGFLFKDLPEMRSVGLDFFNKKIYAGISIDNKGKPIIKTKNVDFCIGKEIEISFDNNKIKMIIPLVAIECKTYLDKTMFSEAQFTAQKLKQGSPNVSVFVFSEENQVDKREIPSKGQTPVDQIFIIEDASGKISNKAIYEFFKEVREGIIKATRKNLILDVGKILPE